MQIFTDTSPIHLFPKIPTLTPPPHFRPPTKNYIMKFGTFIKTQFFVIPKAKLLGLNHMLMLTKSINKIAIRSLILQTKLFQPVTSIYSFLYKMCRYIYS